MGASATHLDWTMVPYVRKSFYKHFKDGLDFTEEQQIEDNIDIVNTSIENEIYRKHTKAYKYAMRMLEREVYQAVEGMYHNLKY